MLVAAEPDRDIHLRPRRLFICVQVLLCMYDYVCMKFLMRMHEHYCFLPAVQYSCPATWALNACWLQQHFNILQRGLSSQFSSLIYCYSQQLSQPICKDVIFKPQRIRKGFICCQERHHRAQTQFLLSLSFPVTEAVRFLLINVISCQQCPISFLCMQIPKLLSMEPERGLRAGGTKVTINGEHLNIGSEVKVKVNTTQECIITK